MLQYRTRGELMGRAVTISLFLVEGDPSGIICAYLSNWTGQCIKIPRNLLDKAKNREEINSMGIYFLFGYSEENPDDRIVYIGEADNVYRRLVQHAKDEEKLFWTEAIAFTSKDDFLTKGHIKYLEHELISISKVSSNFTVYNKNNATKSNLPEMAVADMQTYLDNVKIILPALGYDLLSEITSKKKENKYTYHLEQSGLKAKGVYTNTGFTVLEGSEAALSVRESLTIGCKNRRNTLMEKGILKEEDGKLLFTRNYEFTSPSTAAAIIVGYAINGRQSWKDKSGKSLKENEEDILDN